MEITAAVPATTMSHVVKLYASAYAAYCEVCQHSSVRNYFTAEDAQKCADKHNRRLHPVQTVVEPVESDDNDLTLHYGDVSAQDIYTNWESAPIHNSVQWYKEGTSTYRRYETADLFNDVNRIIVDDDSIIVETTMMSRDMYSFDETTSARFYAVRA